MPVVGAFMVPHPPLIVNEIGKGKEQEIKSTVEAYHNIAKRIAALKPETIVLTTPHSIMYSDYFHISPGYSAKGDFSQYGAPNVQFEVLYDSEFISELDHSLNENNFPGGTLGEKDKSLDHATMVPLYFINQYYKDYKLVRIGLSGLSALTHYTLGKYIKMVSEQMNRNIVVIASGDLSHKLTKDGPYGYAKEGAEYDNRIMKTMESGNFLDLFQFDVSFCDKASECGHRSFLILAGTLDKKNVIPEKLSYEGPFGVGYGICSFTVNGTDETRDFGAQYMKEYHERLNKRRSEEDEYVRLARLSLEYYVHSNDILKIPEKLPKEMLKNRAGVFVSIKKDGLLRGCIGTTAPTRDSIAMEIIYNAIHAGTEDPRFEPVTEEELVDLIYSVDVLAETEPINSLEELDVKKYGVIVSKGRKRGLLLPNLDGVDTVEEQIAIAKRKAGIKEEDIVELERFEVIRHT